MVHPEVHEVEASEDDMTAICWIFSQVDCKLGCFAAYRLEVSNWRANHISGRCVNETTGALGIANFLAV